MKTDIVKQFLDAVPDDVYSEVSLNIDIANHISDMLKARKLTQREFAKMLGKKESEVSRWLTGIHGFNTSTLALIGRVLGEPVVRTGDKLEVKVVFSYSQSLYSNLPASNKSMDILGISPSFIYNQYNHHGKN